MQTTPPITAHQYPCRATVPIGMIALVAYRTRGKATPARVTFQRDGGTMASMIRLTTTPVTYQPIQLDSGMP